MYLIINKTKNTCTKHVGSFPDVDRLLNEGDKIIIISTYSNTIKVPYFVYSNGETEWEWRDFSFNPDILNQYGDK